jgi:hypothetical protein
MLLTKKDYWKFAEQVTANVAIGLICDFDDPADIPFELPDKYEAISFALTRAIFTGKLKACNFRNTNAEVIGFVYTDLSELTVEVTDLKSWLLSIDYRPEFFFPDAAQLTGSPEYLNKHHPRYSPKLAAAVNVWLAMEDDKLLKGKATKAAITYWLKSRYEELGLTHNGNMSIQGIEDCAKVANWNSKGGATATPSS